MLTEARTSMPGKRVLTVCAIIGDAAVTIRNMLASGDTGRDGDAGQTAVVGERLGPDASDAGRDRDAGQAGSA
jgi:hypothetical protein